MSVFIRPAEDGDIESIVEMAYEFETYLLRIDDSLVQEAPPMEVFKRFLLRGFGDEKHTLFVAEEDGGLLGFADFWAYPEFLHGGVAGYMNNIFVREGERGRGIGKALLDAVMDEARSMGVVAMHVPVKARNTRAIEFYKKNGIDEQLYMMETRLDR